MNIISTAIGLFFAVISSPFVWIPFACFLAYVSWQNWRKTKWVHSTDHIVLLLEVPRTNDKKELSAEQMFASLHGILRPKSELIKEGVLQEHISFELAAVDTKIRFYVWAPRHLQNFIEGQIYAQYPSAQIKEVQDDYTHDEKQFEVVHSVELKLNKSQALPIKTFPSFEVDPLAGITATLAKLNKDEEMWIQIITRPIDDSWHTKGLSFIEEVKGGSKGNFWGYIAQLLQALWKPPEADEKKDLSERQKSMVSATEEKIKKLGYQVKIRIVYKGSDRNTARLRMQAMIGTFKQFNTTNLNGFDAYDQSFSKDILPIYRARLFLDSGFILNIEELASVYHLPHTSVETPNLTWASVKTAEPPSSLPKVDSSEPASISPIGTTNFRGNHYDFGFKRSDRGRHIYMIGQTGTGKSGALQLLTLSDVFYNQGFGVIDPHGDYATNILKFIPEDRIKDVVYFNPADTQFPIAFNPLEVGDPSLKNHISSELVGVLKRMFESWGPRLEYILRYTILALLDYPDSTMLDITKMLTEKDFRDDVISKVDDPVVKNFWVNEFASWNEKFASEAVAPVLNKVGAFVANPLIRNVVGQPKSAFNIRQIMDDGKILIINLSKGLVGEDNAAILGALMVTKIQLAAMSRANIENLEDRRQFYLYVDEFQNFATDSFAVILSEARKYGLNLTIANQYVSQMEPTVKDAVFGNVGSLVAFRVGPDDSDYLAKQFRPVFEAEDLSGLANRDFVISMSIDGEKAQQFSGRTLTIPPVSADFSAAIIENSRSIYSKPISVVEELIRKNNEKQLQHSHPQTKHQQNKKNKNRTSNNRRSHHNNNQKSPDQGAKGAIEPNKHISLR